MKRRIQILGMTLLTALMTVGFQPMRTPYSSKASTPRARSVECRTVLLDHPDDPGALTCYRDAMIRLGHRKQLVEDLHALRMIHRDIPALWFFEAATRMPNDPINAEALMGECIHEIGETPWCILGNALTLRNNNRPEDALLRLLKARSLTPENPELGALEIQLRLALKDTERAQSVARGFAVSHPNSAMIQLALAELRIKQGRHTDARIAINTAKTLRPDWAMPHQVEAKLQESLGDTLSAARAYQAAIASDPEAIHLREDFIEILMQQGRSDIAIDHMTTLMNQRPNELKYRILLANALIEINAPQRALGWTESVLKVDASNTDALQLRARALIAMDQFEVALKLRDVLYADSDKVVERRIAIARALANRGLVGRTEGEFTDAVRAHPHVAIIWLAYADWYTRRQQPHRAEMILRQALELCSQEAVIHAAIADAFEMQGKHSNALTAYRVAARLAPSNHEYEDEIARLEFIQGKPLAAIIRWRNLVNQHPEAERATRRLALAYSLADEPHKATQLLQSLLTRYPEDSELKLQLGESLLRSGNDVRAIKILKEAIKDNLGTGKTRALLAMALANHGQLNAAEGMFDEAINMEPTSRSIRLNYASFREHKGDRNGAVTLYRSQLARNPNDRDALAGLSRILGQKQALELSNGVLFPSANSDAELKVLAGRAGPTQEGELGTVLRDEREVHVDERGIAQIRHTRSILIKLEAGVERYQEVNIAFHARYAPRVVKARTLTPDGAVFDVPKANQATRNPHEGTALFGDARHLVLKFERLEPGAIIDYEVVTYRPHPDLGDAWWDSYILGNADPTVRARYRLTVPAEQRHHLTAPGLSDPTEESRAGLHTLTWERYDLPGYSLSDGSPDELPAVYISNMADWSEVDDWYQRLFRQQTRLTRPIIVQARRITRGKKTRREKIAAVYQFVETTVKYLGIEFGIGAYQPRPVTSTLAQARGDCKDMTALMVALLDAIGIESHPALVRPRDQGTFIADHPSPGQFSHVLLYVPDRNGDLWLDATSGMGTIGAIPNSLRGQHAFVVNGRGGALVQIPKAKARNNRLSEQRSYALNFTGGGQMTSEILFSGDLAGTSRQKLLSIEPGSRSALISAPGYLFGQGYIPDQVSIDELDSTMTPLRITGKLRHSDLISVRMDGALVIDAGLDIFTNGLIGGLGSGPILESPRVIERQLEITPPEGYQFTWKPITKRINGPLQFEVKEKREGHKTTFVTRLQFAASLTERKNVTEMEKAVREIRSVLSRELVITPGPSFSQLDFYRALVAERPKDADILLSLGRILVLNDKATEAIPILHRVIEIRESDIRALSLLTAAQFQTDDFEGAEKTLRSILKSPNATSRVYLTLVALLEEQNRRQEATEIARQARLRFSDEPAIEQQHVQILLRLDRKDEALETAQKIANGDPDNPTLQSFLGDLASDLGRLDVAEAAYRLALRAHPDDARLLNNLAWMLRNEPGNRPEAIELALRAVEIEPGMDSAWDTLAELYFMSERYEEALSAIERAISVHDDEPSNYRDKRRLYLRHTKKKLP